MLVLGIETSCDETAAAVVDVSARRILSNVLYSQVKEHAAYQGVIPELASRAHLERLPLIVQHALAEAAIQPGQLNAIAATTGPGLTTALLMGATFGKTMAVGLNKPFLATNHIEGHALSPHLTDMTLTFPYLLLLVSGGHTQLVMVHDVGRYEMLGTTVDDASGECFDKVGKLLGLPHPAGPAIEKLAAEGNPTAINLPFPKNDKTLDFSFSGLKTAVRDVIYAQSQSVIPAEAGIHVMKQERPAAATSTVDARLREHDVKGSPSLSQCEQGLFNPSDLAASLQARIASIFVKKCRMALEQTNAPALVAAGGVAANGAIRTVLADMCSERGVHFTAPPLRLCTDNAAMIAYAGGLRHLNGLDTGGLETSVRPRWPLAS